MSSPRMLNIVTDACGAALARDGTTSHSITADSRPTRHRIPESPFAEGPSRGGRYPQLRKLGSDPRPARVGERRRALPHTVSSDGRRAAGLEHLAQALFGLVVERRLDDLATELRDLGKDLVRRRAMDQHDHRGAA